MKNFFAISNDSLFNTIRSEDEQKIFLSFFYKIIPIDLLKTYIKNMIIEKNKIEIIRRCIEMEMNTRDAVMKKLLDAQENVRDYEVFSKKVKDEEVASAFKQFAEESGRQARKLQALIDKYDKN